MSARTESGALRTYRTARTAKRCDMHLCFNRIQPGERYLRTSLPPLVDVNSSEHWWSMNICGECAPEPEQVTS